MLGTEELEARRSLIAEAPDLAALLARLTTRARPLLDRMPGIPAHKAMLTTDGGFCPTDGTPLGFDPWNPTVHRCPRCGQSVSGERHDRAWARQQHLWLSERAAHLAAVGVLGGDPRAAARSSEILTAYGDAYQQYSNADNVLGPSRLFFSTYLESIWLTNYLAAALLLREGGELSEAAAESVSGVADEAANIIGDFDEGFSNRQTWNNAALAAIAVWFEDADLAERAVQSRTGLLAHLLDGFRADGMWYEGENYHLFALRGLLVGASWARLAGVDLFEEPETAKRLAAALRAPTWSALPDFTFPARKDSRFGVSLAQPMYLELWEMGVSRLAAEEDRNTDDQWMHDWLGALYSVPAQPAQVFDSYLHEAGEPPPARRSRADLSWWALLEMLPALEPPTAPWRSESVLLEAQGLAVLRTGERYASLECGDYGGGHGHPDRLHLTLHAGGVHWLPDPGTSSYVSPDLFWYRSTLAHNAPRLDGVSQEPGDAECDGFDARGGWAWVRGRFGPVTRTIVSGPAYLLDLVELADGRDRLLELPWHYQGDIDVSPRGRWESDRLEDKFVSAGERFIPESADAATLRARHGDSALHAVLPDQGELLRAQGPGVPGSTGPATFLLYRGRGRSLRFVTALAEEADGVRSLRTDGTMIEVETLAGTDRHRLNGRDWLIEGPAGRVQLEGLPEIRPGLLDRMKLHFEPPLQVRPTGEAPHVLEPPPLAGTPDGFDQSAPLTLEHEDQYRRSEDPFLGPEQFSATAWLNWNEQALYVAVSVRKAFPTFRPGNAPPLRLDNETDDIHSDGVQLYLHPSDDSPPFGWLIVPEPGAATLRVRAVAGTAAEPGMVTGAWRESADGYSVTLAVTLPGWKLPPAGTSIGFDLLVNEQRPGRVRRAGQLVWSGGGGWVWLRGDRQDETHFGTVELLP